MENVQVRQAVLADLAGLVPLFDAYRQFYGRESDEVLAREFLRGRFNHGQSVVFIALDAAENILGFAQLYPSFSSVMVARTYILNDLYVVEHARRRGVARALLNAATEYARSVRAIRLTLSTLIDNASAQALYRQQGWLPDEQFKVFHKVI